MAFKANWTEAAIQDLKTICSYFSDDNTTAARSVGDGVIDHVRMLEAFPYVGPAFPRRSSGAIREIVYRNLEFFTK